MPQPLAICLEDLNPQSPADRYLRCVAVVGRQPGLGLRGDGAVVWKNDARLACELWVSADDRLIAYRREGAPDLIVRRAGRSLQAPTGKPVVLLDQDELVVGGREVRIHVHGVASSVHEPSLLAARSSSAARFTAMAAAAVALTAAVPGCNKDKQASAPDSSLEVREAPPAVAMPEPEVPDASDAADAGTAEQGDASAALSADAALGTEAAAPDGSATARPKSIKPPPIEVRETPPDPID